MGAFRQCRCIRRSRNRVGGERERPRASGLRDDGLFLGYEIDFVADAPRRVAAGWPAKLSICVESGLALEPRFEATTEREPTPSNASPGAAPASSGEPPPPPAENPQTPRAERRRR